MKLRPYLFLAVFIAFIWAPGCNFRAGINSVSHNKVIDGDLRNEMEVLNKKLFKSILSADVKGVKQMMGEALLRESGKSVDTIVTDFGNRMKGKNYAVLDEFYLRNVDDVHTAHLSSDRETGDNYRMEFEAINKETYVSMLVSTGLPVNCLIMAVYGKYDNGWKLNLLQMGDYSVMDQTAPDYYSVANAQAAKGNYIDAVDMIVVASQLAHPAGKYFEYEADYNIRDSYAVIIKEAEALYHLPLTVTRIKTLPQIFGVSPFISTGGLVTGIMPVIKYKSAIPFTDTTALKAENDELQKMIGDVFQNINKNKAGIYYKVFNTIPTDSVPAKSYSFVQTIKYSTHY